MVFFEILTENGDMKLFSHGALVRVITALAAAVLYGYLMAAA